MNLEQLQAMSDAELNELSATKVMGWTKSSSKLFWNERNVFIKELKHWNPTTDMNDAMELKAKIRELTFDDPIRRNFYETLYEIVNSTERDWFLYIEPKHITIASILAKEE